MTKAKYEIVDTASKKEFVVSYISGVGTSYRKSDHLQSKTLALKLFSLLGSVALKPRLRFSLRPKNAVMVGVLWRECTEYNGSLLTLLIIL